MLSWKRRRYQRRFHILCDIRQPFRRPSSHRSEELAGQRRRARIGLPFRRFRSPYPTSGLTAVWDLVKDWSFKEMNDLRNAVPKQALNAPFRGGTLRDLAVEVVAISDSGLAARKRLGPSGETEQGYLQAIHQSVERSLMRDSDSNGTSTMSSMFRCILSTATAISTYRVSRSAIL